MEHRFWIVESGVWLAERPKPTLKFRIVAYQRLLFNKADR